MRDVIAPRFSVVLSPHSGGWLSRYAAPDCMSDISGDRPLLVQMRTLLAARKALPLCLSLCDELCVDSDYRITLSIFDRPVMGIRLRGRTRLYECSE